jgi:hypothetical protein
VIKANKYASNNYEFPKDPIPSRRLGWKKAPREASKDSTNSAMRSRFSMGREACATLHEHNGKPTLIFHACAASFSWFHRNRPKHEARRVTDAVSPVSNHDISKPEATAFSGRGVNAGIGVHIPYFASCAL